MRSERIARPGLVARLLALLGGSDEQRTLRVTGPPIQDFAYRYDLVGNVTAIDERVRGCGIADTLGGRDRLVRDLTYDAIYRLVSATGRACRDIGVPRGLDDLPRCSAVGTVSLTNAPEMSERYVESYVYDGCGNLVSLGYQAPSGSYNRSFGIGDARDPATSAPMNNRLASLANAGTSHSYAYDANGNLVAQNTERHHAWDHADRMVGYRVQPAGSAQASIETRYLYGADGMRVKKWMRNQQGQVLTTLYVDGAYEHHQWVDGATVVKNDMLQVKDGDTRVAVLRIGPALDARDASPPFQYCLGDHLGGSHVVVGGDDAQASDFISREEYFAYGETSLGGYARKRYRHGGKECDEESGLYYYGARYLAPWLGRWVSTDPLSLAPAGSEDRSWSPYCFVNDSPLRLVDAAGLTPTNPSSVTAVHSTPVDNLAGISKEGLRAGSEGHDWLGTGAYLNDSKSPFASLASGSQLDGKEYVVTLWTVDTTGFETIEYDEFRRVQALMEMQAVEEFWEMEPAATKELYERNEKFDGRTGRVKERLKVLSREYWNERLKGKPGAVVDWHGEDADTGRIYVVRDTTRLSSKFEILGKVARTAKAAGAGMWEISTSMSARAKALVEAAGTPAGRFTLLSGAVGRLSIFMQVWEAVKGAYTSETKGYFDMSGVRWITDESKLPPDVKYQLY